MQYEFRCSERGLEPCEKDLVSLDGSKSGWKNLVFLPNHGCLEGLARGFAVVCDGNAMVDPLWFPTGHAYKCVAAKIFSAAKGDVVPSEDADVKGRLKSLAFHGDGASVSDVCRDGAFDDAEWGASLGKEGRIEVHKSQKPGEDAVWMVSVHVKNHPACREAYKTVKTLSMKEAALHPDVKKTKALLERNAGRLLYTACVALGFRPLPRRDVLSFLPAKEDAVSASGIDPKLLEDGSPSESFRTRPDLIMFYDGIFQLPPNDYCMANQCVCCGSCRGPILYQKRPGEGSVLYENDSVADFFFPVGQKRVGAPDGSRAYAPEATVYSLSEAFPGCESRARHFTRVCAI